MLNSKIQLWGCGLIGASALVKLNKLGYDVLGYDISSSRIQELGNMDYKKELNITKKDGIQTIKVTSNIIEVRDYSADIHIICVPTEECGMPSYEFVLGVLNEIILLKKERVTIIFESTLVPRWIKEIFIPLMSAAGYVLNQNLFFACCPRRDWFNVETYEDYSNKRVVGASNNDTLELIKQLYSQDYNLVIAKDHHHAALSKVIENSIRFLDIAFTNELANNNDSYDTSHLMSLAGTKWNINTFFPSMGIGGYCIPLAPLYMIEEFGNLSILNAGVISNKYHINHVMKKYDILERLKNIKNVAIYGMSYAKNTDILSHSPSLEILEILKSFNVNIYIKDKYTEEKFSEYKKLEKSDIRCLEMIFLIVDHENDEFYENLKDLPEGCYIYNNNCREFEFLRNKRNYFNIGDPSSKNEE